MKENKNKQSELKMLKDTFSTLSKIEKNLDESFDNFIPDEKFTPKAFFELDRVSKILTRLIQKGANPTKAYKYINTTFNYTFPRRYFNAAWVECGGKIEEPRRKSIHKKPKVVKNIQGQDIDANEQTSANSTENIK